MARTEIERLDGLSGGFSPLAVHETLLAPAIAFSRTGRIRRDHLDLIEQAVSENPPLARRWECVGIMQADLEEDIRGQARRTLFLFSLALLGTLLASYEPVYGGVVGFFLILGVISLKSFLFTDDYLEDHLRKLLKDTDQYLKNLDSQ